MSVKAVAVLDESALGDGEMKEVDFGEGKVLLSRIGDKIHATSAFCTHYGAPLVKGTLTADGRVVCPWHGACFNICTGDIEDAPALDAIHTFKTEVKDGKIIVTADAKKTLKDNKSRVPKLSTDGVVTPGEDLLIIGGGAGTIHAVESLRENGYKGNITILTKELNAPLDRTKLSKALIADPAKIEWRSASELKIRYNTNLRHNVTVTKVDPTAKTVTFVSKEDVPVDRKIVNVETEETLKYDKLLLASGGTPRFLPIEGTDAWGCFTLRRIQDAEDIDGAAKEGKRMVVIGSSFICMEVVVAVQNRKLASIDVIGMEEYPFEAVLGKEIGKALKEYHESNGVRFHMQSKVERIVRSETRYPDRMYEIDSVVIENGPTLPADFVVMGVGVTPATQYLKDSGFKLEKDGGIRVDEYLRVPGYDNIYAIGDIAHYPQKEGGELRRIEHWNVASNHGRAVAQTIVGKLEPFAKIPIFWSAQGQQLRYAGVGHSYDDIYIQGNPSELKFVAWYFKEGKVIAVASMQADPIVTRVSELMRLGLTPSAEEIRNGVDILSIDISSSKAKAKFST